MSHFLNNPTIIERTSSMILCKLEGSAPGTLIYPRQKQEGEGRVQVGQGCLTCHSFICPRQKQGGEAGIQAELRSLTPSYLVCQP